MQCVILVGGLGTRLGELARDVPKPMLPVGGRPFLELLIDNAARYGFSQFLLLAGHRADIIAAHFPGGVYRTPGRTVSVNVLAEPQPLGTGGALRFARELLAPQFLMLNGDSLFDFNWLDLLVPPLPPDAVGVMALRAIEDASRYGVVEVGSAGKVTRMLERSPSGGGPAAINGGVYVLRRSVLDFVAPDGAVSLERDVFPRVIAEGRLYAKRESGYFIDIGVPDDYARAQTLGTARRGAVFFDRDGVLNRDEGYTHRIEGFAWLPGAAEAVKLANDRGLFAFVVTNQAGVARGLYTEQHVRLLHAHMQNDLRCHGAHIDDFRFCPHHPDAPIEVYRRACSWRKPGSGMLLDLVAHWPVDLARSLLIGDTDNDIAAATAIGLAAVKVQEGADLSACLQGSLSLAGG